MKRTLIISALALGLFAFGCDDDTDMGGDGGRDGGDAGDARGDTSRADGSDAGAPDILPPDTREAGTPDAVQPVDAVVDMATGGGSIDTAQPADSAFAVCKPTDMTGVAAIDFCGYVQMNCGFGAGPGKFIDTASCMLKYNAYTAEMKSCAAYHACVAGTNAQNAVVHCPHPVGVANNNPCNLPL
jgi:hypothetical protein